MDSVPLMVNALTPGSDSELKSVIPYDYYDPMFNFCQPKGGPQAQPESLGSILFGDRIWDSAFKVRVDERWRGDGRVVWEKRVM